MIKLFVGLGNPGPEYEDTRHNAGFWWIDALARELKLTLVPDKGYHGQVARTSLHGQTLWLLKPQTFMNLSGKSVAALARFFKIQPHEILVAHDELDLPPGTVRLKTGGGHGGHNGLRSIIGALANQNGFHRLRLGIGHPGNAKDVSGFVLTKAPAKEQELIERALDEAVALSDDMIAGKLAQAMNKLNGFKATL